MSSHDGRQLTYEGASMLACLYDLPKKGGRDACGSAIDSPVCVYSRGDLRAAQDTRLRFVVSRGGRHDWPAIRFCGQGGYSRISRLPANRGAKALALSQIRFCDFENFGHFNGDRLL